MKNTIEYILFLSFSYLFRLLGLKLSRKIAPVLGFIFYNLIPIRKEVTLENLRNAFPDYTSDKIKKIAKNCYKSLSIALIEILYMPWMNSKEISSVVKSNNLDLIEKKFQEGQGVILLSAHYGNWEFAAVSVAVQINRRISVVVKPQRNPFVNNWMNKARTKWNNDVIPMGISIRQIYAALKNGEIVAMASDQRGPEESIKLEFFGRKTAVFTGPAVLALKTGAPLLYGIPVRGDDYIYNMKMLEVSKNDLPEEFDEKVKVLCERMLSILEGYIREHPEQWFWMHRRWKH